MSKRNLVLLSMGFLVLAGALSFGVAKYFTAHAAKGSGMHSETAAMACSLITGRTGKEAIMAKDKMFMGEYRALCAQLCGQRALLSQYLPTAAADDQKSVALLERINQLQAKMETMAYGHILAVRDALPVSARAAFIKKVQRSWQAEQKQMRNIAGSSGGACADGSCANGRHQPGEE